MRPFFSIGVTTYDRKNLLKETLASIVQQRFTDFEVLVGNDFTQESLCGDSVGVKDPRVQFLNHPENLGELKNMNLLLTRSRGRYFTWLADDDLYAPDFLLAVHSALVRFEFPPCVFTSYDSGGTFEPPVAEDEWPMELYSGGQFLDLYLSRRLRAVGCYGVFERDHLSRTGGMEPLGTSFSPYSDNLLAIRAGLLDRVGYVNTPLVFYRTHSGSISYTSGDVDAFRSAQADLLRKSVEILQTSGREDTALHLYHLLRWCLVDFGSVARKAGGLSWRQAWGYASSVLPYVRMLRGSGLYGQGLTELVKTILRIVRDLARRRISLPGPGRRSA